jgi:hypothetical protein
MSDEPKPTGLDARIDAVLREVVREEGPADLRRRVMAELAAAQAPSSAGWLGARLVPVFGVAAGLVVAAGLLILAWPDGAPPRTTVAVSSPSTGPVAPPPAPAPTPVPGLERPQERGERSVRSIASPLRPRRQRLADPPGWRDGSLEALTVERIDLAPIGLDVHAPAEIALVDVDLVPVDLETSLPLTAQ